MEKFTSPNIKGKNNENFSLAGKKSNLWALEIWQEEPITYSNLIPLWLTPYKLIILIVVSNEGCPILQCHWNKGLQMYFEKQNGNKVTHMNPSSQLTHLFL